MNSQPTVTVIIINWNTRDLLARCIDSIEQTTPDLIIETIVVDNASTDGSQAMLREKYPQVQLIANQKNVGFARANNQAMQVAKGQYFLLWNSDAFATSNAIQTLLQVVENKPRAAIIGARLINPDNSFQASYTNFPNLWQEFLTLSGIGRLFYGRQYPSRGPEEKQGPQPVDYVEGACLLVRPAAYQAVGGMDEGFFMYAEEVDWCFRLQQQGWQVWYQPQAKVIHLGGGSSNNRRTQREADLYRSRVRFFRKHYGDRSALILKLVIYGITAIKSVIHGVLRFASRGRYGRTVVSLNHLSTELRNV